MGIPRIPEPELMDAPAQARAYAESDFNETDRNFAAAILDVTHRSGRVVDLGCGPGNIARLLARSGQFAEVHGVDGSAAMLEQVEDDGVAYHQVLLQDVTSDDIGGKADVVVSNSLLHHMHDPSVLWRAVVRLSAPGAVVVITDLRRPETLDALEEIIAAHAGTYPDVLRHDFEASLHAAFTVAEIEGQLAAAGLPLEVTALGDRHVQVSGTLS